MKAKKNESKRKKTNQNEKKRIKTKKTNQNEKKRLKSFKNFYDRLKLFTTV